MSITFSYRKDNQWSENQINMANGNAAMVLEALGYEYDNCGAVDSADLVRRCIKFLNTAEIDRGETPSESQEPGKCRVINCGRREGYLQEKITLIRDLALEASRKGVQITFG